MFDADASKRPRMAAAACAHADVVWLTSDNPRTEDPETILEQVEAGVPAGACTNHQVDRGAAIRAAIAQSGSKDVVVIAGKGHERVQLLEAGAVEFDDVQVAQAALAEAHGL